jgi:hypothetical protein
LSFSGVPDSCSEHPLAMGVFEVWVAITDNAALKYGVDIN